MNHIETMKLALDALQGSGYYDTKQQREAITALRQAIQEAALQKLSDIHQEMEQKPVAWWNPDESGLAFQKLRGDWQPLYAAPVHAIDINQKHVDETAKDKHEPDAYGDGNVYRGQRSKDSTTKTLHYTEPLRNSWFKLTDAEVWDEWVRAVDESNRSNRELAFRFARAIEAKLREKNRG